MSIASGTLLHNRYRILSTLGQGGMGAVYCALDENLGVQVAVKENLFLSDEYTRQFRREATILAGLRHPNLPHVRDHFLIANQGQYLVMDFIEGEDLRERMERLGRLPDDEIVRIGASICDALTYLHTRVPPIVHRDIKPGNIKITAEGQMALVDFGLAKIMHGSQETTGGARAMTPGFSPPEQYGTARTDPRSDIYSLGATLYAAASNKIPEDGLARATGYAKLTELRKVNPKISRSIANAIEKALELQPGDRFQTAEEFKNALLQAGGAMKINTQTITVSPPPPPTGENHAEPTAPFLPQTRHINMPPKKDRTNHRRPPLAFVIASILILIILSTASVLLFHPENTPWSLSSGISPTQRGDAVAASISTSTPTILPTPDSPTLTPVPTVRSTQAAVIPTVQPTAVIIPDPGVLPIHLEDVEIAFVSNRTGLPQLWVMSANGLNQEQLTDLQEGACQPDWSPDGMKIVFISPCKYKDTLYPGAGMYILDLLTRKITRLPSSPEGDFDPAWSPDGKSIAYTSLRTGKTQLYILGLDSTSVRQITNQELESRQPEWSPDGEHIVFNRIKDTAQIWIMVTADGLTTPYAVNLNRNNTYPIWSPDGQVIYFISTSFNTTAGRLVGIRYDPANKAVQFLIPTTMDKSIGPVTGVSVSPDSTHLVYESWPDGKNHDIYSMTVSGTQITRLTSDKKLDFDPAWRPAVSAP